LKGGKARAKNLGKKGIQRGGPEGGPRPLGQETGEQVMKSPEPLIETESVADFLRGHPWALPVLCVSAAAAAVMLIVALVTWGHVFVSPAARVVYLISIGPLVYAAGVYFRQSVLKFAGLVWLFLWAAVLAAWYSPPDMGAANFGVIAALFVLYFLPSLVAACRHHNNTAAIVVVNLFLGWSFIGWVLALVWAFLNPLKVQGQIAQPTPDERPRVIVRERNVAIIAVQPRPSLPGRRAARPD
jgi:hypothetical protein